MTRVECPSCDGEGCHGYEAESGLPFTCYACGGTGWVTADEAADWRLAQRYARADDEVREGWDEGSSMARSELAGLLEG